MLSEGLPSYYFILCASMMHIPKINQLCLNQLSHKLNTDSSISVLVALNLMGTWNQQVHTHCTEDISWWVRTFFPSSNRLFRPRWKKHAQIILCLNISFIKRVWNQFHHPGMGITWVFVWMPESFLFLCIFELCFKSLFWFLQNIWGHHWQSAHFIVFCIVQGPGI